MKLIVIEFVSLDGVSQGPGSPEEDTSDEFTRGGWLVRGNLVVGEAPRTSASGQDSRCAGLSSSIIAVHGR